MKHRALVIDDDPNAIDATAETMSSLDHDFDTACSQSEAVRLIQLCTYSYIVLDIMIPARTRTGRPRIQNTENFLERLAKICGDNMPPVIITSDLKADNTSLSVEMMRLAGDLYAKGVTTFIEKPFPAAGRTLDRVIKKVLGKTPIRLTARGAKPPAEPPATEATGTDGVWLTVPQAAELLKGDLPGLNTNQAKARISTAATRGEIKTNGKSNRRRRIDRHTFSTWRLAQRGQHQDATPIRVPVGEGQVRKRKSRRHETPAQTSSTAGTALTIPERDILQGMVEARGETMLQVDVMAAAGYGKHATSTALKRLRELALVCQPHGSRKGNALTDKGRKLVASWGGEGNE